MLRTALTPRFLGPFALLVAVLAAFGWLGVWQFDRARGDARVEVVERARAQQPVDLTEAVEPHAPFRADLSARPVTAVGTYAADGQVLVPGRLLEGRGGSWVITPFVVDATGATLPVLRGFVTDPADAGPPPRGRLTVAGGLAPGESPSSATVPDGQIGSVDLSLLVNTWPGDLYNTFLFLESETPDDGPQLTRVPTPLPPAEVDWRNAGYALQWWVFAGFAVWVYLRMLRDESVRGARSGRASSDDRSASDERSASVPVAASPLGAREDGAREHS
ncbi:MAG: SURF1 family protein [Dermatophilaceae bacterium]